MLNLNSLLIQVPHDLSLGHVGGAKILDTFWLQRSCCKKLFKKGKKSYTLHHAGRSQTVYILWNDSTFIHSFNNGKNMNCEEAVREARVKWGLVRDVKNRTGNVYPDAPTSVLH